MEPHPKPDLPEQKIKLDDLFDIEFERHLTSRIKLSLERTVTPAGEHAKDVTFKLYLTSLDYYGTIYSKYEKYGYLEFDDELVPFSAHRMMELKPNERKLLFSYTKQYPQDLVAVRVKGCIRAMITLEGYYVNQVSLAGLMIIKDPS